MKLIRGCLLAVAIFGCLANAQISKPGDPQRPQPPQKPSDPQRPQPPPRPQPPQKPSDPQRPQPPPRPQLPQKPSDPQRPQPPPRPQLPQTPPRPQPPQKPSDPQRPLPPQKPSEPQRPLPPQKPSEPQRPLPPQKPSEPQRPRPPPRPQLPQKPSDPQRPQPPQKPSDPQRPQPPQKPSDPQRPQPPQKPSDPKQTSVWPPDLPNCDVDHNDKISCGPSGVSAGVCESLNCCFDGRMCYYGKYVTLQCTKDGHFIVVISKDVTLPNINPESIYFYGEDDVCQPVAITSSFIIYMFPVTACGTVQWDEPDAVVYENRMYASYEISAGAKGMITRDTSFDLIIQARYIGSSFEALIIEVSPVPPPRPVAALGYIHVGLYLGSGQCTVKGCNEEDVAFTSYYADSDYPITKVLRDPVYVDVALLERTDPNLVLTLGRCWVTADPSPNSYPQWDLLINGCPNLDDNYLTKLLDTSSVMYPGHHRRFVFRMFTFITGGKSDPSKKVQSDSPQAIPSKELMYIHCNTAVCIPTANNNCEPRCFRKKREIVASAVKRPRSEIITVSSKGIEMTSA